MKIYQTEKIFDNVWMIREHYAEDSALVMGLIVGEEKAALIDSGMGVFGCELRDVVRGITDKPIVNLLTHGHPDHIAGSVLFDEVYMSARDDDQIPRLAKERRLGDVKMFSHNDEKVFAYAAEHCLNCSGFQYKDLRDGDVFDLGGVKLEILALPGHSLGSVAVFNREANYCFAGDAFSDRVPASSIASLEAFQEMADGIKAFMEKVPQDTALYHGHWLRPITWDMIRDEQACAQELANRQVENDEDVYMPIAPIKNQKKHTHGSVWISYNPAILK